jgi:hypothetical protein
MVAPRAGVEDDPARSQAGGVEDDPAPNDAFITNARLNRIVTLG